MIGLLCIFSLTVHVLLQQKRLDSEATFVRATSGHAVTSSSSNAVTSSDDAVTSEDCAVKSSSACGDRVACDAVAATTMATVTSEKLLSLLNECSQLLDAVSILSLFVFDNS